MESDNQYFQPKLLNKHNLRMDFIEKDIKLQ